MEIGPQPHGVVRSNIYTAMKVGVQHMLDWVRFFNSGAVKCFCFATRMHLLIPFLASFQALLRLFCFYFQVLFLKEDLWMCSPWLNTSTTRETMRLATSQQPFILNSRYSVKRICGLNERSCPLSDLHAAEPNYLSLNKSVAKTRPLNNTNINYLTIKYRTALITQSKALCPKKNNQPLFQGTLCRDESCELTGSS